MRIIVEAPGVELCNLDEVTRGYTTIREVSGPSSLSVQVHPYQLPKFGQGVEVAS